MARLRATAPAARSVLDGREHGGTLGRVGSRSTPIRPSKSAHEQPSKSEITLTCAGDDPRTAPPFPLPPNVIGGIVDPAVVGTWEFAMNPGRWVWKIAANGTYEFHTEAPDGAPSHAGTFVANGGTWTLVSIAGYVDTDGGTYLMQGPNTMVMTGKLGTGGWQRITAAAPAASVKK
jgi:hypothetical protein